VGDVDLSSPLIDLGFPSPGSTFLRGRLFRSPPPSAESRLADPRPEVGTWSGDEAMPCIGAEDAVASERVQQVVALAQGAGVPGSHRRGRV
jgi:hypothetical protein